jgi:hypothetical protein
MDDEMKKASEDFTVKIERIENNRTKHSFSLWENVSDASFASELTSAGMYVVKSANIVLLMFVALLAFIVASMLRAQDISLRTHLYSMANEHIYIVVENLIKFDRQILRYGIVQTNCHLDGEIE